MEYVLGHNGRKGFEQRKRCGVLLGAADAYFGISARGSRTKRIRVRFQV